jgi:hypothetical protein
MPGDLLKLHICFKSEKGGIFTEKWEFVTEPKLLSGASLVLTLRGVAIQEDKHKKTRALIEVKRLIFGKNNWINCLENFYKIRKSYLQRKLKL